MASREADPEEYGLEVEDEHHSLIELQSTRNRPGRSGTRSGPSSRGDSSSSKHGGAGAGAGKWVFRSGVILFVLALVAVYHLGLEEGKAEVEKGPQDYDEKKPRSPASTKITQSTQSEDDGLEDEDNEDQEKTQMDKHGSETPSTTDVIPNDNVEHPPNSGSFTLEKLEATRKASKDLLKLLDDYYNGQPTAIKMLVQSWVDPWNFDENDGNDEKSAKTKRAKKLIDTMARALVTDDQTTFLMGAIGSSVVAGHDNCHYDSYESQLERMFGPIWEKAGMDFVFQNAGEGGGCGDSHENQIYCIKQNISPNIDIVHYSWTYFEHGQAFKEHESLIRWTQMLPRQPPVHIMNCGIWKNEGPETKLVEYYAEYGYNAFYMRTGFLNGGHDYEAEKKREKDPFDRFSAGFVGDGYHNTTRYGEMETDEARKTSLGVVMRNWHPGPMGFQLASDSFGYIYTIAILQALDLIEKELKAGNDPRKIWDASERPLLLKSDLPEPLYCDPQYCVVDEAPGCLNYEKPTFGFWGARVEDPNDDLNPHKGEIQNWSVWQEENNLWHMVGKQDTAVFQSRDDKEICRHLDACGGISASKAEDGMVVFRLPKMEVGLVIICGCCGKDVATSYFIENPDIEIRYNTVVLDPATFEIFPNRKCVRMLERFPTQGREAETPTGHAYLSIKVVKDMSKPVRISHVITL